MLPAPPERPRLFRGAGSALPVAASLVNVPAGGCEQAAAVGTVWFPRGSATVYPAIPDELIYQTAEYLMAALGAIAAFVSMWFGARVP